MQDSEIHSSDVDCDVGSDADGVVTMSTAGYVKEGKQQRRHRAAYGCLVFVALLFFFLVTAVASITGWYLISHRDNYDNLFHDDSQHPSRTNLLEPGLDLPVMDDGDRDMDPPHKGEHIPFKPQGTSVVISSSTIFNDVTTSTTTTTTTTTQLPTTSLPPTTTTESTTTSTTTTTTTTSPPFIEEKQDTIDTGKNDVADTDTSAVKIDKALSVMVEKLWQASQDKYLKAGKDYTLNFQGKTTPSDTEDRASKRLFQQLSKVLKKTRRHSAVHRRFFDMLDNYNSDHGSSEISSQRKTREIDHFLDELLACDTFQVLDRYITDTRPLLQIDTYKTLLRRLWFEPSDSSSTPFERVFVGERNTTHVLGLNNWLRFSQLERDKSVNYQGYISKHQLGVLNVRYTWEGIMKPSSIFFVGTSPDFEIALYTLCYVVHPNDLCAFNLQGHTLGVKTTHDGVEVNFNLVILQEGDNR